MIEVWYIWDGSDHDSWPEMCEWLQSHGLLVRPNNFRPPASGEVQWLGRARRIDAWQNYDWQYLFHEDNRDIAALFKLTWGGK